MRKPRIQKANALPEDQVAEQRLLPRALSVGVFPVAPTLRKGNVSRFPSLGLQHSGSHPTVAELHFLQPDQGSPNNTLFLKNHFHHYCNHIQ